jgi:nitroreductase
LQNHFKIIKMNLEELLNFRRSVRVYDRDKPLDSNKVKHCLELATLAPNSSNMQLWEFYHITQDTIITALSKACLDQKACSTASEIVVFVTRQDLHRKRAKFVLEFETGNIQRNSPTEHQEKRIKDRKLYYGLLMPFLYSRFIGIIGLLRKLIIGAVGIFRPIVRQVSENDMRVVVHKSCALAAQTFMIAMVNEGYDTCPLEGFDSNSVKKILNLPCGAEINMVVSCGIRQGNRGIWGERCRVPFEEVYFKL